MCECVVCVCSSGGGNVNMFQLYKGKHDRVMYQMCVCVGVRVFSSVQDKMCTSRAMSHVCVMCVCEVWVCVRCGYGEVWVCVRCGYGEVWVCVRCGYV